MRFFEGRSAYQHFPYWDRCAIRLNGVDHMLCPLEEPPSLAGDQKGLVGFPSVIWEGNGQIYIWPTPNQDFEVVRS